LAAILLLVSAIDRTRSPAVWAGLGAAVAALALVKINIGAYVGAPVLYGLLRASPANAWTKLTARMVAAALLAMPLAVEAILFDLEWVRTYCLFSTLTVLAALIVSKPPAKLTTARPKDWAVFIAGGILASVAAIGSMMLAGSSPYAILNAVVLQTSGGFEIGGGRSKSLRATFWWPLLRSEPRSFGASPRRVRSFGTIGNSGFSSSGALLRHCRCCYALRSVVRARERPAVRLADHAAAEGYPQFFANRALRRWPNRRPDVAVCVSGCGSADLGCDASPGRVGACRRP
jgi:hypothetical protein